MDNVCINCTEGTETVTNNLRNTPSSLTLHFLKAKPTTLCGMAFFKQWIHSKVLIRIFDFQQTKCSRELSKASCLENSQVNLQKQASLITLHSAEHTVSRLRETTHIIFQPCLKCLDMPFTESKSNHIIKL